MKKLVVLSVAFCFYTLTFAVPRSKTVLWKTHLPAHYDTVNRCFLLRNEQARFGRKFLRGSLEVLGYDMFSTALLFALPYDITKWSKPDIEKVNRQYRKTFTQQPVYDPDPWYVNFIGHPYTGACYYNAVRSQGAPFWQAILFTTGYSVVWEYVAEGGLEQPSIQDLVVTPVVGCILGELIHHSTMVMSRNGFKWYEKAFVCVFNPMFAINNGFKYAQKIPAL